MTIASVRPCSAKHLCVNSALTQAHYRLRMSSADIVTDSQNVLAASISYPHPLVVGVGRPARAVPRAPPVELRTSFGKHQPTQCIVITLSVPNMATCYSNYELQQQPASRTPQLQKDYSRPLHVDCSVEYELPNQAKPPAGVRNEPLLMIHPCYFRKIESQRRSPFVNNLPNRQQVVAKRRLQQQRQAQQQQQHATPAQLHHQAVLPQAAQYPVQFDRQQQLWEPLQPLPPLIPISTAQTAYAAVKREHQTSTAMLGGCGTYGSSSGSDSGHWTDSDRSPEKPEDKHILTGKYRQYLRAHRLHPYVTSSIPIAATFPQQVCYNV